MKLSLIAVVVMLAVAQASNPLGFYGVNKSNYMRQYMNKMMEKLNEVFPKANLTDQAHALTQYSKTQVEPLVAKIEEMLKTLASDIQEQINSQAAKIQDQIQAQIDDFENKVEAFVQQVTGLARTSDA